MVDHDSDPPCSRTKLLQAAQDLMGESGYAAVTSRKVAARAGLKPQLVHYYFNTMDDLFLAVYQRWANDLMARQEAVLSAEKPLREMWNLAKSARGVLLSEFVALANHRKIIQQEFAEFGDRYRRIQIEIVETLFARNGVQEFPWTPVFVAALVNSMAGGMALENGVGISEGHAETQAIIEQLLEQLDA